MIAIDESASFFNAICKSSSGKNLMDVSAGCENHLYVVPATNLLLVRRAKNSRGLSPGFKFTVAWI